MKKRAAQEQKCKNYAGHARNSKKKKIQRKRVKSPIAGRRHPTNSGKIYFSVTPAVLTHLYKVETKKYGKKSIVPRTQHTWPGTAKSDKALFRPNGPASLTLLYKWENSKKSEKTRERRKMAAPLACSRKIQKLNFVPKLTSWPEYRPLLQKNMIFNELHWINGKPLCTTYYYWVTTITSCGDR